MRGHTFECFLCKAAIDVAAFLEGLGGFRPETSSAAATCPACGGSIEFQVRSGSIELGYTYWAGSLHFEGVVTVRVPGIRIAGEGDSRVIEADGVVYRPRLG